VSYTFTVPGSTLWGALLTSLGAMLSWVLHAERRFSRSLTIKKHEEIHAGEQAAILKRNEELKRTVMIELERIERETNLRFDRLERSSSRRAREADRYRQHVLLSLKAVGIHMQYVSARLDGRQPPAVELPEMPTEFSLEDTSDVSSG